MKTPLIFLLMLSGCTTVADLQAKPAFIEAASDKSLSQLSECFARQWQARSGTVNSVQRDDGFTMTLTYVVYSSTLPAAVIDVDEDKGRRKVVVHARKGDDGQKLRGEIGRCV